VWPKNSTAPGAELTTAHLRDIERNPYSASASLKDQIRGLARQYRFFHWHLEFPTVFDASGAGGFDCVLGNPPWERTAFEAVPYFSLRVPEIAAAETTAKRERLIAALPVSSPDEWNEYQAHLREAQANESFYSGSGAYPFSSSGRTNTFALFAERSLASTKGNGYVGLVLPSALATDIPYTAFWSDIIDNRCLISMFDFENRGVYFPHVHRSYKFSLFTIRPGRVPDHAGRFGFFLDDPLDTRSSGKTFRLRQQDVSMINPLTKLMPVCGTVDDFVLLAALHRRADMVMSAATPWVGLTSSATSRDWHFNEAEGVPDPGQSPLWEAKCIHHFNHRYSTYVGTSLDQKRNGEPLSFQYLGDPSATIVARYHIPSSKWTQHLKARQPFLSGACGYRDVARSTDERTMIAAIAPFAGFMQPLNGISVGDPLALLQLVACLNSFALDYSCRLKTPGTHVNVTICRQLPMVWEVRYGPLAIITQTDPANWIRQRSFELTFSAWDLASFARDCGWFGPPFRWDEERRFLLRCELDAAFFHLYLPAEVNGDWQKAERETEEDLARLKASFPTPREAVAYIMDTFDGVCKKDRKKHNGDFRTKRVILEIYDAMQAAIRTGQPYQTRLDPPPADPRCCHPPRGVA
jgi:hypothetical protein